MRDPSLFFEHVHRVMPRVIGHLLAGTAMLLAVAACGADQTPTTGRTLEPQPLAKLLETRRVIRLEPARDDPIGRVRALAVWNGSFVVVDGMQHNAKVFDGSGRLLLTIGRSGSGPGEFRNPCAAVTVADGSLAILDCLLMRVSFFDSTGTVKRSWGIPAIAGSALMAVDGGNQLVVAARRAELEQTSPDSTTYRESGLHVFALDGTRVASFGEAPRTLRRYEGSFSALLATAVGTTLTSARTASNTVTFPDLPSGREWSAPVGARIYTEPEFPRAEVRDQAELMSWAQRQMWLHGLIAVDSSRYLVRFVRWGAGWTPSYEYALATIDGETIAVTLPTPMAVGAASGDAVFGTRTTDDGDVEIVEFRVVR